MARKKESVPTDRELAILGFLWENGPSTVREVHESISKKQKTGYTTTFKFYADHGKKRIAYQGRLEISAYLQACGTHACFSVRAVKVRRPDPVGQFVPIFSPMFPGSSLSSSINFPTLYHS